MAEAPRWQVRRVDELEQIPVAGAGITWRPIRRTLGIRAFGMNAYTAEEAGQRVVEEHTETALGHEEVYVVLSGRARFTLDDEDVDAPTGTIVHLRDPAVRRAAVAEEPGTTVLAVGARPGEAYRPSAWEWWFAAAPDYEAGDYEAGLAIVREGLAEQPDHPVLLYQTACYESLAGRHDEAVEHLRRALELDERTHEWARADSDLDPIRLHPAFPAVR